MPNVNFCQGTGEPNSPLTEGAFYVDTEHGRMWLATDTTDKVEIGNGSFHVEDDGNGNVTLTFIQADGSSGSTPITPSVDIDSYTVTVETTGWSNTTGGVKKDITVNGITADDEPIVDVVTSITDLELAATQLANYQKILSIETKTNGITLYASGRPSASFDLILKVIK